jgi:hypothetical protein
MIRRAPWHSGSLGSPVNNQTLPACRSSALLPHVIHTYDFITPDHLQPWLPSNLKELAGMWTTTWFTVPPTRTAAHVGGPCTCPVPAATNTWSTHTDATARRRPRGRAGFVHPPRRGTSSAGAKSTQTAPFADVSLRTLPIRLMHNLCCSQVLTLPLRRRKAFYVDQLGSEWNLHRSPSRSNQDIWV